MLYTGYARSSRVCYSCFFRTHSPGVPEVRGVELDPHLTIWVEPVTGMLVSYKDETIAYCYDIATHERLSPWNRFSNTFTDASIEDNVKKSMAV